MSSSYQPLPREELDVLFIPPQTYYNDGPFDPPSSDDEADAETLLDNDEPSRNGRRDEESYPVKGSPSKRHSPLRYFLLSLAALVGLALLIALFTAFSYPWRAKISSPHLRHITLDHIYNGTFGVERKYLNWVPEAGDGVFSSGDGSGILLTDLKTNTTEDLLRYHDVRDSKGNILAWSEWKLSADMNYVLVKTDYRKQWRWSSFGNYYIHRLSDHSTHPLSEPKDPSQIAYATWSPTGQSIAYVEKNDLYVLPDPAAKPIRVSSQGNTSLFFGVPDWVYEEEVFGGDYALWWSPDSQRVAFLRLDETKVPDYTFPIYNPTHDSSTVNPYTEFTTMKYPKPGYPNPIVGVYIFDLAAFQQSQKKHENPNVEEFIREVDWQRRRDREDSVIMEVAWVANSSLLIKEVSRAADEGAVVIVDLVNQRASGKGLLADGKVARILGKDGEQGDEGWIDNEQHVYRLPEKLGLDEGAYLDIVPTSDGFNQIALYNPGTANKPRWLTTGEEEVTKILTVDVKRRLVYYMVASDKGIGRKLHSASIPKDISDTTLVPSIPLTDDSLTPPSYYDVSMSPQGGFYLLSYNGPHVPWQRLIKVGDPEFTQVYTTNERLNQTVYEYQAPDIVYSTIENDGYELNTREIRPPNMDISGATKYPVLFEVYGGPGSQKVDTKFQRDWHHYLACSLNYIIVVVDGRGTGYKGRKLRRVVKGDLGFWETKDQIAGARIWGAKPYVDASRIGVWGWSYGGFMAAKVVEANAGVHSLAMSVAPVISWRMYDTIYTERYMDLPDKNPSGYLNASITDVLPFDGFNYLLAHGSGDDNVHFANTAHLLDMFTQNQVRGYQFRMFTDSDHSIATRNAHREVYEFMTTFLTDHWGKNGANRQDHKKIFSKRGEENRLRELFVPS